MSAHTPSDCRGVGGYALALAPPVRPDGWRFSFFVPPDVSKSQHCAPALWCFGYRAGFRAVVRPCVPLMRLIG